MIEKHGQVIVKQDAVEVRDFVFKSPYEESTPEVVEKYGLRAPASREAIEWAIERLKTELNFIVSLSNTETLQ